MKYIITYNNENNYDQLGGAGGVVGELEMLNKALLNYDVAVIRGDNAGILNAMEAVNTERKKIAGTFDNLKAIKDDGMIRLLISKFKNPTSNDPTSKNFFKSLTKEEARRTEAARVEKARVAEEMKTTQNFGNKAVPVAGAAGGEGDQMAPWATAFVKGAIRKKNEGDFESDSGGDENDSGDEFPIWASPGAAQLLPEEMTSTRNFRKMAAGPAAVPGAAALGAVVPAGVKMAAVPGAAALGAAVPDVGVKMAAGPDVGVKMAAGPAKRKAKRKGLKLKPVGNKGFGFINNEKNVDPAATKALADAAAAKVLADAAAAKALADAAAAKALADAAAAKALADAAAAAQYQIEYNKPDKGKNVNSILQQQQQQQQQQMQQQQQQQQMEQQRKQLQQQLDQQNSVSSFDTDSCCSSTSSEM